MDTIAVAVGLIGVGLMAGALAWLGRSAGWKAVLMLGAGAVLGVGGGIWMLWP